MTKYYNMKDCFDACGDDDKPYLDSSVCGFGYGFNSPGLRTKKEILHFGGDIPYASALSDKWQIQRAEQKVLTESELYKKACDETGVTGNGSPTADRLIELSDKNGQLKEWIRHKELREACDDLGDYDWEEYPGLGPIKKVLNALSNLKPPV